MGKASTRIDFFRYRAPNGTVYIDCEVTLPDGTILFAGEGKFSQLEAGISLAVTGGTGAYSTVHGTATLSAPGEEGTFLIAFDLVS